MKPQPPEKEKAAIVSRLAKSNLQAESVLGLDPPAVGHFALVNPQAEAAIRIGADPCLEHN